MKWYSVKKYVPPNPSGECLIAECDQVLAIARYVYVESRLNWEWVDQKGIPYGDVSHFCIPDPIEIEE